MRARAFPRTHFIDETIEQVVMLFYCLSTQHTLHWLMWSMQRSCHMPISIRLYTFGLTAHTWGQCKLFSLIFPLSYPVKSKHISMAHPFCILHAGRANRCRTAISIASKYAKPDKFIYYYRLKYRDWDSGLIVETIAFNYCVFNSVDASIDNNHRLKCAYCCDWPQC